METTTQRLERLFHTDHLTDADREWLREYLDKGDLEELRLLALEEFSGDLLQKKQLLNKKLSRQLLGQIHNRIQVEAPQRRDLRLRRAIAIAASILIIISIGAYVLLHPSKPQEIAQNRSHNIAPGSNKAILTLANGQKIVLGSAVNGTIALQGRTRISKTAPGLISYAASPQLQGGPIEYNTLTTPRGGQHSLVLPDGTTVMLDAASSITYPVAFNGSSRNVIITGQVYFKVKHDPLHPFSVSYRGMTVQDIGTEFNINAYEDEPAVQTTLISGAISLKDGSYQKVLKPGEQAQKFNGQPGLQIRTVDLEGVTAWKNNYFLFDNDDLASIMRKVSRWYNVEVVYEYPEAREKQFGGTVSRFKDLSSLLDKLELTGGVHFHIEGNKIIITK